MRDAHARQPFGFGKVEEALHLAVEAGGPPVPA